MALYLFHDGRGLMEDPAPKRVEHMTHTTVYRLDLIDGRYRCTLVTGHEVNVDEEGARTLINLGIAVRRD